VGFWAIQESTVRITTLCFPAQTLPVFAAWNLRRVDSEVGAESGCGDDQSVFDGGIAIRIRLGGSDNAEIT
jgi:hypothetical protein